MIGKSVVFILMIASVNVYAARTDCPKQKIQHIQIEGNTVMYQQVDAPWRRLGTLTDEDGTRERYSALLAAQASGKDVMVGYPIDNFDCSATNFIDKAYIVRTYN